MTEELSTRSVPLKWAAKTNQSSEPPNTAFFAEGRIVTDEPAKREPNLDAGAYWSSCPIANERSEKSLTPSPFARVPQSRTLRSHHDQRYILLKKYEGFITVLREDSFSGRLFESDNDYPQIDAEFALDELSESDRQLIAEGAQLVWTIGYSYDGSTRKRESLIYLRRPSPLGDKELAQARRAAGDLTSAIGWE